MKTNNNPQTKEEKGMTLKSLIKETEEEIERFGEVNKMGYWADEIHDLELKLKLLKQFQKEIKEVQGELKESSCMDNEQTEEIDKIFKNKFG